MEIDRHSNDRKPAETESRALRDVADRIVEALAYIILGAHSPTAYLVSARRHHAAGLFVS